MMRAHSFIVVGFKRHPRISFMKPSFNEEVRPSLAKRESLRLSGKSEGLQMLQVTP